LYKDPFWNAGEYMPTVSESSISLNPGLRIDILSEVGCGTETEAEVGVAIEGTATVPSHVVSP
jgi:hypothetical protein